MSEVAEIFRNVFSVTGLSADRVKKLIEGSAEESPEEQYVTLAVQAATELEMPRTRILAQWFNILCDVEEILEAEGEGVMSESLRESLAAIVPVSGEVLSLTQNHYGTFDPEFEWFKNVDYTSESGPFTDSLPDALRGALRGGSSDIALAAGLVLPLKFRAPLSTEFAVAAKSYKVSGPTLSQAALVRLTMLAEMYFNSDLWVVLESDVDYWSQAVNRPALQAFSKLYHPVYSVEADASEYNSASVLGKTKLFSVWTTSTEASKDDVIAGYLPVGSNVDSLTAEQKIVARGLALSTGRAPERVLWGRSNYREGLYACAAVVFASDGLESIEDYYYNMSFEGKSVVDAKRGRGDLESSLRRLTSFVSAQYAGLSDWS